jgi:hypothetical protein
MGAKLELYKSIQTRIGEAVREINHVAKWNNQTNDEPNELPFDYPAVFIGFSSITWNEPATTPYNTNLAANQQQAEVTITLYCAFWYKDEETQSFELYEPIVNKIYEAVNGLQSDNFTPLNRVAEREDNNHGPVIVWEIDFTTRLTELVHEGSLILAPSPLSVQLTGDLIINPITDATIRTAGNFDEDQ